MWEERVTAAVDLVSQEDSLLAVARTYSIRAQILRQEEDRVRVEQNRLQDERERLREEQDRLRIEFEAQLFGSGGRQAQMARIASSQRDRASQTLGDARTVSALVPETQLDATSAANSFRIFNDQFLPQLDLETSRFFESFDDPDANIHERLAPDNSSLDVASTSDSARAAANQSLEQSPRDSGYEGPSSACSCGRVCPKGQTQCARCESVLDRDPFF